MTTDAADSQWTAVLEDATAIAEEYQENGWDAIVLEPDAVSPVDGEERTGFDVEVSPDEYEFLERLIESSEVTVTTADVYYRPPESDTEQRVALAVERDDETETAVFVPLKYDLDDSRAVFETALRAEELLLHVTTATPADDGWVSFSHDDPSLFLEESDVREWSQ
ncbi:DUF7529 family protein [Natronorubrum tibetense]|uniref:Uncharacterized protein n=1 Tax=Natronorubrum tibetense GA33 TaxID=1114856 RepID=L9WBX7_9EURY|nr:hypothetical protein [Natronorubrum tibetense]ELY46862.1 hypothetical protein C496_00335 [Natronorubrum tibetense GA33]